MTRHISKVRLHYSLFAFLVVAKTEPNLVKVPALIIVNESNISSLTTANNITYEITYSRIICHARTRSSCRRSHTFRLLSTLSSTSILSSSSAFRRRSLWSRNLIGLLRTITRRRVILARLGCFLRNVCVAKWKCTRWEMFATARAANRREAQLPLNTPPPQR
ncbi:hypothetical protein B0T26DRAFT_716133 [Lasiosphaeria miniovina]|uniref:Secreted protein n=1 Tax=Lasiosphaeria miniovina TaxID=1954250 RepID=A0AA40AC06_9PEZI|nr:uncharacterized protein B0T26DRAFT_716133 [Lasiosphaeria miniovina]KAK0713042.1 hypothetical protein B0T26DRAFT_716133 [Lasiosphaeria miniovina]